MSMEIITTQESVELCEIALERLDKQHTFNSINEEHWEKELNTREKDIAIKRKEREKQSLQKTLEGLGKKKIETEEEIAFFLENS